MTDTPKKHPKSRPLDPKYQPSKKELEERIYIPAPTPEDLARAVMRVGHKMRPTEKPKKKK